jgi:signal peptidase I
VPPPTWQRFLIGRNPLRTMIRAVILAAMCFVVFKFALLPIRITGPSMEPTYHDGGVNFVNRLSYLWRKPRRGDVVAIRTTGVHIMFLKRVIALPGETIAIENGIVAIDGMPLDEPYVKEREPWEVAPVKLKSGQHFVIGDNRGMNQQLHKFGTVETDRILGKPLW